MSPREVFPLGGLILRNVVTYVFPLKKYLEENITMPTSSKRFKESWLEGSHEILPRSVLAFLNKFLRGS